MSFLNYFVILALFATAVASNCGFCTSRGHFFCVTEGHGHCVEDFYPDLVIHCEILAVENHDCKGEQDFFNVYYFMIMFPSYF
jgi:hypothetical protein